MPIAFWTMFDCTVCAGMSPGGNRLMRAAQHELEKDSADKYRAIEYENMAHRIRNTSIGITFHDGIERVDNT